MESMPLGLTKLREITMSAAPISKFYIAAFSFFSRAGTGLRVGISICILTLRDSDVTIWR